MHALKVTDTFVLHSIKNWKLVLELVSAKAKFAGVGTFFKNRFPSLGIFVNKKVGIQ